MKKFLMKLCAIAMILTLMIPASASQAAISVGNSTGKTVILHSNDIHGAVASYTYMLGLKKAYEKAGAEVIMVDAGDYSQGTTYVSTSKGLSAVRMMNKTGYNYATLGNHEFDYGYPQLKKNMKKANFTVLCANVFDAKGNTIFKANDTYTTKSGLKIGFFGINTPESQTKANPALIKGLTFLSGEAMYKAAQDQIDALADTDLVICLSHLGVDSESVPNTSYDLYNNTKGIDYIIDGHSHTVMTKGTNGEPIQSTGTAFANIGVIVIDDTTKSIDYTMLVAVDQYLPTAKSVTKLANKYIKQITEKYGSVFATSEVTLNGDKAPGNRTEETNNGDLITDAMIYAIMKDKSGLTVDADHVVAITNGGGIRAAIAEGDVTMNDIHTVLPFGNTIDVLYLTGAELLEALEASTYCTPGAIGGFPQIAGMEITIDTTKAYDANSETYPGSTYYGPASINRVTIDSINGKAFKADDVYAVITSNFCSAGGDTYYAFRAASARFETSILLDEAVVDYVTNVLGGVIGSQYSGAVGRITVK